MNFAVNHRLHFFLIRCPIVSCQQWQFVNCKIYIYTPATCYSWKILFLTISRIESWKLSIKSKSKRKTLIMEERKIFFLSCQSERTSENKKQDSVILVRGFGRFANELKVVGEGGGVLYRIAWHDFEANDSRYRYTLYRNYNYLRRSRWSYLRIKVLALNGPDKSSF